MRQVAPEPEALYELVEKLRYKPGWSFSLVDKDRGQGSEGLTLQIYVSPVNAYHHEEPINVVHYMIVPAAAFDRRSWQRWLLDQILLVEQHEACEFFQIGDEHLYGPSHGPGNDPYLIREVGTELDQRTSFRGVVKEGS